MKVFFDSTLPNEFARIYKKFKNIEQDSDKEYQSDLNYILKNIQKFEPLKSITDHPNFNVASVDGSGTDTLISLNDIAIHLFTAAYAADRTVFEEGTTSEIQCNLGLCGQPNGFTRFVLLRENEKAETWKEFNDFVHYNYGDTLHEIVVRVLTEMVADAYKKKGVTPPKYLKTPITGAVLLAEAKKAGLTFKINELKKFDSWMVSAGGIQQRGWFDQFREVAEYALVNELMKSDPHFKYIFLDGSMNLLITQNQDQPRLAPNYLLRDLCLKALKKDTCLIAVSKTTSFPFLYRIANDIETAIGEEKKWFIRIPKPSSKNITLNILKNKPNIPPKDAVTYLFHFSSEVPILRIDFDLKWWNTNIKNTDPKIQKQREMELFKEIDWLARDVRYYGYFFDLALSHNEALVKFTDRDLIAERLIEYFVEQGENPQMFIHPRKRLGLM